MNLSYGQPNAVPYTLRMTINQGTNVNFIINSQDKYISGSTLTDWTKVLVCYNNPDLPAGQWEVHCRAMNNIENEFGDVIPFANFTIETTNTGANALTTTAAPLPISVLPVLIASDGLQGTENDNNFTITYILSGGMIGMASGHYTMDMELILSEE